MELFEVENRLRHPQEFRQNVIKALEANGAKIDLSKTIAGVALYHGKKLPVNTTNATFFSGEYVAKDTNIPNSFQRAEAEHIFISGMRIWEAEPITTPSNADWIPVDNDFLRNADITITSNGVVMLKRIPLNQFLRNQTGKYVAEYSFSELIVWLGQTELKAEIKFQDATQSELNVRVELLGVGLVS